MERRSRELERRRREIAAQIEMLQAQLASAEHEEALLGREGVAREDQLAADRIAMGASRQVAQTQDKSADEPARKPKT